MEPLGWRAQGRWARACQAGILDRKREAIRARNLPWFGLKKRYLFNIHSESLKQFRIRFPSVPGFSPGAAARVQGAPGRQGGGRGGGARGRARAHARRAGGGGVTVWCVLCLGIEATGVLVPPRWHRGGCIRV